MSIQPHRQSLRLTHQRIPTKSNSKRCHLDMQQMDLPSEIHLAGWRRGASARPQHMPKHCDQASGMEHAQEARVQRLTYVRRSSGYDNVQYCKNLSCISSRSWTRNLMTRITYTEFQQSAILRKGAVIEDHLTDRHTKHPLTDIKA